MTYNCFISYSHDDIDRDTLEYVIHILKSLLGSGTNIYFDQRLHVGDDFQKFMALLDQVDAVILILTPAYKRKVIERQGGVYEEYRRICARYSDQKLDGERLLIDNTSQARFLLLPILFSGSRVDATPNEITFIKQLDFAGLHAIRKPTGEFQVPRQMQETYVPQIHQLATQIHAAVAVRSEAFQGLSQSYYDRLFVDLKAKFDDPMVVGSGYLDSILVKTNAYSRLESQLAHIVIGRKGSGKSTLAQVLPILQSEKYYGVIKIVADKFSLEQLYGLHSDPQFRSDVNNVISRILAFEFTWEALLMLESMDLIVARESTAQLLQPKAKVQKRIIAKFIHDIKGSYTWKSQSAWQTSYFFSFAFAKTIDFVRDCIDQSRSEAAGFSVDINVRFNRERYLHWVFGESVLGAFRQFVRSFDKRFLVTLDGLDTAFDEFRLAGISSSDPENLRLRTRFEIDWLRSLLSLVTKARDANGDYFYSLLDFCITAPKDRFMEIIRMERDSYRHWHRWCALNWSGVELAILLRKRLEFLINYKTSEGTSPEDRLNEILRHKAFRNVPSDIKFDYNGKSYEMPLFMYVLRHTFWRPREILTYYAAILAMAEVMRRWNGEITSEIIRNCVKATTKQVIESEFIAEFKSTVLNIGEIIGTFKHAPIIMSYEHMRKILLPLNFFFASGHGGQIALIEKVRFLYDVGFLGIRADKSLRSELGLDCDYAFSFNEDSSLLDRVDESEISDWHFVIHPIFSEYLRLNRQNQELVLYFDWKYLRLGDAKLIASPNA